MKALLLGLLSSIVLSQGAIAHTFDAPNLAIAPQPTACISSQFSSSGTGNWKTIALKLTNNCGKAVDFQNSVITFQNKTRINARFWGDFSPLSYPDNNLRITSIKQSPGVFLATLVLHFPTTPGANSQLPAGNAIFIKYTAKTAAYIDGSAQVYLTEQPVTGSIELTNASAKPNNVSQNAALVHIKTSGGQLISDVQLAWSSVQMVPGLAPGSYSISADSVTDTTGITYQGTAVPPSVTVAAQQVAKSTITYNAVQQAARVAVKLQALPTELSGYTGRPTVTVTQAGTGSSVPVAVNWNTTATVSSLRNGSTYNFSTPTISFNGFQCQPVFTPPTLVASEATPIPTTNLTYSCTQVAAARVTVNVNGAPTNLTSLKVTFTPNNNTAPVTQTVALSNGSGSNTQMLVTNVVYNVSADAVSGYSVSFNPQPLTATNNAVETITLTQQGTGTPVAENGQLSVCGTKLCNEKGVPIQLKGMSSHGIQWYGWNKCLTAASLDAVVKNFKSNVFRISLYVQEGGYETDPTGFTNQVNLLVEEATKRGIYVIVDWHILTPGNPNDNLSRARTFFTAIATAHKNKNNIIYEIANEPNGVSWSTIKSYADQIIPVIRAIDPKNVIIVGTVAWSSLGVSDGKTSQEIINNPVNFPNIMYAFHFYAASHRDNYLNELDRASNTLPIFVTEFGTQTYSGDGNNDFAMSDRYMQLMATKKIGWANWNYSDDFRSGAVWKTGTCTSGQWTDANLKPAGVYIKGKIMNP